VKRSPMPRRKKGLDRTRPARAVDRATSNGRTVDEMALIRQAVYERDGRCRLRGGALGPCFGKPYTPHHLRKAGQGGAYSMSNLLTLCAGHNDRIEELPRLDMELNGLVIPRTTDLLAGTAQAWGRMQLAEIVTYWWDGTPAHRPAPTALADGSAP
jgi:hypothetical protein